jgi:hypothetical protein
MLILITKSELFTCDPDTRFSKEYKVSLGTWKEMWRRHCVLGYSVRDMAEYYEVKTKRKIAHQTLKRWNTRTKVFIKTKPVLDKGCETVNSYFFGELEWFVLKELMKNTQSSVKQNVKTLP